MLIKHGSLETEKRFSAGNVYGLKKLNHMASSLSINSFPLLGPTYQLIPMYDLIGSEE